MKKLLISLLFLTTAIPALAQTYADYKYALVPAKFDILKERDQYNLNTHAKMFMQKYGFTTFLSDEKLPDDFALNNCNKIYVDLEEDNTMFLTKIRVVLKDCRNNVLLRSEEGVSREKEFKKAYQQALRAAFNSLEKNGVKAGQNVQSSAVQPTVSTIGPVAEAPKSNGLSSKMTETGFDILNQDGKLMMKLFRSSQPELFISLEGDVPGIVRKSGSGWIYESYRDNRLKVEILDVKF